MRQRSHPTGLERRFEKALPALMLFRAYRNDTPVVFDPHQEWQITGGAIGGPTWSYGNVVKVGVNGTLNHSSTEIGRWDGGQRRTRTRRAGPCARRMAITQAARHYPLRLAVIDIRRNRKRVRHHHSHKGGWRRSSLGYCPSG